MWPGLEVSRCRKTEDIYVAALNTLYCKSSFAHVTFRLGWVQVVVSPNCMIVQIRIPCKILREILGY